VDRKFHRAKELAEATGISENTVRYLIRKGTIASKKIGRSVLIPAAEFKRLISAETTDMPGTSDTARPRIDAEYARAIVAAPRR
jgi:excisionase family DNA binding protein